MRSHLRTQATMLAFLGMLSAGGAQAMAAGHAPATTGRMAPKDGKEKAPPTGKPGATAHVAPVSGKTAGAGVLAPQAAASRPSAAPSTGPKVEARRGRGHF